MTIRQQLSYSYKILLHYLVLILFLFAIVVIGCNIYVNNYSKKYLYDTMYNLPKTEYALLLGTSKYVIGGDNNAYFDNRIKAAVDLFHQNKVSIIIVSGDNREKNYNEPLVMKKDLLKHNIPDSCILIESTGFRTYNSIIAYKKMFGMQRVVIISQKFHNARAVFIARKLNLNAIGYNADDIGFIRGYKTRIREYFAKVKAVIDVEFDD